MAPDPPRLLTLVETPSLAARTTMGSEETAVELLWARTPTGAFRRATMAKAMRMPKITKSSPIRQKSTTLALDGIAVASISVSQVGADGVGKSVRLWVKLPSNQASNRPCPGQRRLEGRTLLSFDPFEILR
jgi:hypothetical protein